MRHRIEASEDAALTEASVPIPVDALPTLHREDLRLHALDVFRLEERSPADGRGVLDRQREVHVHHDLLLDQLA